MSIITNPRAHITTFDVIDRMSGTIQFAKSPSDFDDYLKHNQLLVAQFTASWCGPCRAIAPAIEKVYREDEQYASIEIVKVDLDLQQGILAKYSISSVPTFIFFNKGSEVLRVSGADLPAIIAALGKLNEAAPQLNHGRHGNGTAGPSPGDPNKWPDVSHLIPLGYRVINDSIDFGQFEALNVVSYEKVKASLQDSNENAQVSTEADSQSILYVPFHNIAKIYSVLIRAPELEGDEERQRPNHVKIWANQATCPLFESAVDDTACLHEQKLQGDGPWYECRLKYVRFQNCQNISIFLEGEDEDMPTSWEKILLVGVSGDSTETKTLPRGED